MVSAASLATICTLWKNRFARQTTSFIMARSALPEAAARVRPGSSSGSRSAGSSGCPRTPWYWDASAVASGTRDGRPLSALDGQPALPHRATAVQVAPPMGSDAPDATCRASVALTASPSRTSVPPPASLLGRTDASTARMRSFASCRRWRNRARIARCKSYWRR